MPASSADRKRAPHRRAEVRREELREIATQLFYENGYSETSVQDIAAAMGVLKGSLYYHMASKQQLLFDLLTDMQTAAYEFSIEHQDSVDHTPIQSLRDLVRRQVLFHIEHQREVTIFYREADQLDEELRTPIMANQRLFESRLRELLADGQSDGSVRGDIAPKIIALSILGSMNWTYRWYRPDASHTPHEIASQFAELAISSVKAPG